MTDLLHDLRFALRTLRRAPGFTATAAISLALGIGAALTIFAVVNAFLLRPLPVERPGELVSVYAQTEGQPWRSLSVPDFQSIREGSRSFAGLVAFTLPGGRVSLREVGTEPRAVAASLVSADYFDVLGVTPVRGRFFVAEDDDVRGPGAAVIGERLWRARYDGDPGAVGREVLINRQPFRIVGIAPARFTGAFAMVANDVWLPLSRQPQVVGGREDASRRDAAFLNAIGRLRPGVTLDATRAELRAIAVGLAAAHPETNRDRSLSAIPATGLPPFIRRFVGGFLGLLGAIVLVVLLVACMNVAGLLVARGTARSREVAIRTSLGASRGRIVRQLLAEALVIALLGGALALLVAYGSARLLLGMVPPVGLPLAPDLGFDARVLSCGVALALLAAGVSGVLPALHATRAELSTPLREASLGAGSRGGGLRATLLAAQIALTVLLLVGATLLARGLRQAARMEPGFDVDRIALLTVDPTLLQYEPPRAVALMNALDERLEAIPGVSSAGVARFALLGPVADRVPVVVAAGTAQDTFAIDYNVVGPGYFETVGLVLLRGRDFTKADDAGAAGVAIVGEGMVRRLWPDAEALGQRFTVRGSAFEVIGVVRDPKYRSLGEASTPFVHFALAQEPRLAIPAGQVVVHARASGDPSALLPLLRRELLALDPDLPGEPSLMAETIRFTTFPARLAGRIVSACAALALVLACVGLYGIAAYAVVRRQREIGVRLALGAPAGAVVRLVLRQGARIVAVGIGLGVPAAFAASRLLRGFLYGVAPEDPITYAAVAVTLGCAVMLATWLPARRATRIDPAVALRAE